MDLNGTHHRLVMLIILTYWIKA